jgi:hypothetical protein
MGYEITIRCDGGQGDPLHKRQCLTYAPKQSDIPRFEAATSRDAIFAVERRAKGAGWKQVRQPGRRTRWLCPVCQ